MKVFIAAMPNEAQCAIAHLAGIRESFIHGRRVVTGTLNGERTAVVVSGIGKVNAAAAAQMAISELKAGLIVNFGVAGGFDPAMNVGDVYAINRAVEYDFDLAKLNGTLPGTLDERADPYIPLAVSGDWLARTLGSGDRFTDDDSDLPLLRRLGITVRDMEGAAIAHVCETAGVEARIFKCISDVHGLGPMTGQFRANISRCLDILANFIRQSAAEN